MCEIRQIFVEEIQELSAWLDQNSGHEGSVWLVRWKKGAQSTYISYQEVVDELLCYGWVDSLPRKLDDQRTMLRISPRNPKSNWSKVNKDKVNLLIAKGRMKEPGLKAIDLAKRNGAWSFLDDVDQLILPDDLHQALLAHPLAKMRFDRFPNSSKRGILEWIKNAKQAVTRKKRIAETVDKAAQNIKANHPKGRDAGPK